MRFTDVRAINAINDLLRSTHSVVLSRTAASELKRFRKDILLAQLELEELQLLINRRLERPMRGSIKKRTVKKKETHGA